MKLILTILFSAWLLQMSRAALSLPPDIATAISKSGTGESGGLFVHGADEKRFLDYICAHWREIADNIEYLPKSNPDEGFYFTQQAAINTSVKIFATACEWLPPEEYVEFLNKLADLQSQNRLDYEVLKDQLGGIAKKEDFLMVNYSHPKVKTLIARIKTLIPESDKETGPWLDEIVKGKFADSYLVNKSDNAPLPETLPGVNLQRPFASMIKKFEAITGKKVDVPYDPRFNPRPEKDKGTSTRLASIPEKTVSALWNPWFWMISGLFGVIAGVILKRTKSKVKLCR